MIKVIYEDTAILVVWKPDNVPSQRDFSRTKDAQTMVEEYLGKPVFLIHRLDRHVQGLMVFAKTKVAAAGLNKQMTNHDFGKSYLALVVGEAKESETLVHYLRKEKGVAHISDIEKEGHKRAELSYVCKKTETINGHRLSLLYITLKTGRFHQIRSQLQAVHLPIVGDPKYGICQIGEQKIRKIGLQAVDLSLTHPITKKPMHWHHEHQEEPFNLIVC